MRDLEIRGAGNILGTQQSGHIINIGFDLYCALLKQAIAKLKGEKVRPRLEVVLRTDFVALRESDFAKSPENKAPAFLPISYIAEAQPRDSGLPSPEQCKTTPPMERCTPKRPVPGVTWMRYCAPAPAWRRSASARARRSARGRRGSTGTGVTCEPTTRLARASTICAKRNVFGEQRVALVGDLQLRRADDVAAAGGAEKPTVTAFGDGVAAKPSCPRTCCRRARRRGS